MLIAYIDHIRNLYALEVRESRRNILVDLHGRLDERRERQADNERIANEVWHLVDRDLTAGYPSITPWPATVHPNPYVRDVPRGSSGCIGSKIPD